MDCISKENLKRWREKNKKPERKCIVCRNNFEIEVNKKYVVKSIEAVMIVYYDAIGLSKMWLPKYNLEKDGKSK